MRLLRGLSGQMLPCGCLVGVYETYDGQVLAMVDVVGTTCGVAQHVRHATLHELPERIRRHPSVAAARREGRDPQASSS